MPTHRRILSLWFPRLGAERVIRAEPHLAEIPFATVAQDGPAQVLGALSLAASQAGLNRGQPLRDAHARRATQLACADSSALALAFLPAVSR